MSGVLTRESYIKLTIISYLILKKPRHCSIKLRDFWLCARVKITKQREREDLGCSFEKYRLCLHLLSLLAGKKKEKKSFHKVV